MKKSVFPTAECLNCCSWAMLGDVFCDHCKYVLIPKREKEMKISIEFSKKALSKLKNLRIAKGLTGDFGVSDIVIFKILEAIENGEDFLLIETSLEKNK